MSNGTPFRYYAAEISYFSGKVRPALRYKGIHFTELLPDVPGVILPRTGLAFIPILVTPEDQTLQDTSDILDALEVRFPSPPLYHLTNNPCLRNGGDKLVNVVRRADQGHSDPHIEHSIHFPLFNIATLLN